MHKICKYCTSLNWMTILTWFNAKVATSTKNSPRNIWNKYFFSCCQDVIKLLGCRRGTRRDCPVTLIQLSFSDLWMFQYNFTIFDNLNDIGIPVRPPYLIDVTWMSQIYGPDSKLVTNFEGPHGHWWTMGKDKDGYWLLNHTPVVPLSQVIGDDWD